MKKLFVLAPLALLLALATGAAVLAADAAAPAGVKVTVTGENYGLLAALAAGEAAAADPAYAGINALKVTEAKDHDDLKGKTLHYLPTKAAADLMLGEANRGKSVTVTGTLFKDASALLVESFTAAAAAGGDEWDELPVQTISRKQVL